MSKKIYMGRYTADEYIEYLRKEVKICNEFHKNIIRVQDKKIAKLRECVESIAYYSGNEPIASVEMKLIAIDTLEKLEGNNEN